MQTMINMVRGNSLMVLSLIKSRKALGKTVLKAMDFHLQMVLICIGRGEKIPQECFKERPEGLY